MKKSKYTPQQRAHIIKFKAQDHAVTDEQLRDYIAELRQKHNALDNLVMSLPWKQGPRGYPVPEDSVLFNFVVDERNGMRIRLRRLEYRLNNT